jgi:uncharacterized radical SAM superfamily Fe-S cluster-containing enzyme
MRGLCPVCKKLVPSREVVNSSQVYLEKECPEHGISRSLISSDKEYWDWSQKYNRPGAKPFKWSSQVEKGCLQDCGICPAHKQHTCIGIIEITGECNLRCNVCFADSPSQGHISYNEIVDMINAFVSYETKPEILQLSGGEPTLHPEIIDVIRYAKDMGIKDVAVSTNGIRLLNEEFVGELASTKPVIYLQFDTFKPEVYKQLRGQNLVDIKLQAVEVCNMLEMTTVLVPTIVNGLNENEIGDLIQFGLKQKKVFGINFQPIACTGRVDIIQNQNQLTIPEVLLKIESQTNGLLEVSDFRPIPCPHPHCTAICYILKDNETITPLTDLVDVDEYIDYAKDRTLVDEGIFLDQAFRKLFSARAVPGLEQNIEAFCEACGLSVPDVLRKSVKTIGIHSFMDTNNYQLERAQKCCIHIIQPDGKMIPFCNYNLFHRH